MSLLCTVLLAAVAVTGCKSAKPASDGKPAVSAEKLMSEPGKIFPFRVGSLEVYMLVETERDGNAGILIDAEQAIGQYIPESGFKHSTNTFLIKAGDKNILVDTAFGGQIIESARKLGVTPEQVDAVLLTHLHGDHIGGMLKNGEKAFLNAEIFVPALDFEYFTQTVSNQGAISAFVPYTDITYIEPGSLDGTLPEILPGIKAAAAFGHTPGHTVYLLEDGGEKFLIAGDFLHVGLVQFPVPEISASYDVDPAKAAASRRQILDYAAKNKVPVGGMHIVYPGMGTVEASGTGFEFTPFSE